jgi:hypothetical protein
VGQSQEIAIEGLRGIPAADGDPEINGGLGWVELQHGPEGIGSEARFTKKVLQDAVEAVDTSPMSMSIAASSGSLEDRIREAKRSVTTSGMRVGRMGAMIACVGVAMIGASFIAPSGLQMLMRVLGGAAALFGIVPFMLGWKQAKQGSPFLRALSTPKEVEALLMEEKPLAGDRRSLSVLLGDGTSQSVALPAQEAGELFTLVQELNPAAQCEVTAGAQRQLAALKP